MMLDMLIVKIQKRLIKIKIIVKIDQKTRSGTKVNANEVPAQELHKAVIKKFKKGKVYGNIQPAELAEMRS